MDITALMDRLCSEFEAGFKWRDREVVLEKDALNKVVSSLRQAWIQGAWTHGNGMEISLAVLGIYVGGCGIRRDQSITRTSLKRATTHMVGNQSTKDGA